MQKEKDRIVFLSDELNEYCLFYIQIFLNENINKEWKNHLHEYLECGGYLLNNNFKKLCSSFTMKQLIFEIKKMFLPNVYWINDHKKYYHCYNFSNLSATITKNESLPSNKKFPILRIGLKKNLKFIRIEILSFYLWQIVDTIKLS